MYEDAWYSFAPEPQRGGRAQGQGHRRRESLLQQPNSGSTQDNTVETLDALFEEDGDENEDEDLLLARTEGLRRRIRSYPDMTRATVRPKWEIAVAEASAARDSVTTASAASTSLARKTTSRSKQPATNTRRTQQRKQTSLEALCIADSSFGVDAGLEWKKLLEVPVLANAHDSELLLASQQEFL
ncbi:Golgi transport complex subunit 3 [Sporothrix epigloea]|uniref:Golgi transport complex subunit 3 n=1 Tax=Sporothrix epigloea TaxID=1892477 RepID=A0ABP0D9Z2_9PEZI